MIFLIITENSHPISQKLHPIIVYNRLQCVDYIFERDETYLHGSKHQMATDAVVEAASLPFTFSCGYPSITAVFTLLRRYGAAIYEKNHKEKTESILEDLMGSNEPLASHVR